MTYSCMHPKCRFARGTRSARCCVESLESRSYLTAPTIDSWRFDVEYNPHKFVIVFSQDVGTSLAGNDVRFEPISTTEEDAEPIVASFSYNSGAKTATWIFSDILIEGNYRASMSRDDIENEFNEKLDQDYALDFYFMNADAIASRKVDLDDFDAFAPNMNSSGKTFSEGNFNYDALGNVNLDDFNIFANRFNAELPEAPSAPGVIDVGGTGPHSTMSLWQLSVSGETGWRVQWSFDGQTFGGDDYDNLDPGTFWFVHDGLPDGTRIWYRVRAFSDSLLNPSGPNTAYTPKKSATTTLPAPSSVVAIASSSSEVAVSWVDNSENESGFGIEVSTDGVEWIEVGATSATSFQFTEALPNTQFFVRVFAYNGATRSAPSANTTALTPPRQPEGLTVTEVAATEMAISWDGVSNLLGYTLEWRRDGGAWNAISLSGSQSAYDHTGLIESSNYEYRLSATNAAGTSEPGDIEGAYTMPLQPTGLTASVISGSSSGYNMRIDLSWTDNSSGEIGYVIEQLYESTLWYPITILGANAQSSSVQNVPSATTKQFRVVATNPTTTSQPSNVATATTPSDASDYAVIESISVPVTGAVVQSTTVLQQGQHYKVRATGTVYMAFPPDGNGDAEYASFVNPTNAAGVDYGIGINDTVNDGSKSPYWGPYNGDHVYVVNFQGLGQTIGLNYHDDFYNDNNGSFTVQVLVPKVSVHTLKPQVAEGGSENAQFVVERTGDTGAALQVSFTVSGTATAGSDYTSLGTTVTIPAGARTATIDVAGLLDTNTAESAETVIVTLADANKPYKIAAGTGTAEVSILNRREYLVGFYGFGPANPAGNITFGSAWLKHLVDDASAAEGYTKILWQENKGRDALLELFNYVNADPNKTLSKAEIESAAVRVTGYSFGCLQAINFSHSLNRQNDRIAGFKLADTFAVEALVTTDPELSHPGVKVTKGPVTSNVKKYVSYYQQSPGASTKRRFDPVTGNLLADFDTIKSFLGDIVKGDFMQSNAQATTQTRVDTVWANEKAEHPHVFNAGTPNQVSGWGRLLGNDVSHDTMPWWCYDRAKVELG